MLLFPPHLSSWPPRILGAAVRRFSLASAFVLVSLSAPEVSAQGTPAQGSFAEAGRPLHVEPYGIDDYDALPQNWAVLQGPRGVLWVGNDRGLLHFDGARWESVDIPGNRVRSLAASGDRIWVGGVGTLGYVKADALDLSYIEIAGDSLLGGAEVWGAFVTETGVLFQTFDRALFYDPDAGTLSIVRADGAGRFHKAFAVEGPDGTAVYFRQEGRGLLRFDGDRGLMLAPGGRALADRKVYALLPHRSGLLVGTADSLHVLDGNGLRPLDTPALSAHLAEHRLYDGIALPGRLYALATLKGGIPIVDASGQIVYHLGEAAGLTTEDLVVDLARDAQGGLWAALSEGVVRFDTPGPLTFFDEELGLPGAVHAIEDHGGTTYAATQTGVYRLDPSPTGARFLPVPGVGAQCWNLVSTEEGLLAACTSGLYRIGIGVGPAQILSEEPTFALARRSDGRVLVAGDGLWALESGRRLRRLSGVEGRVRSLAEIKGVMWARTSDGELYRIDGGPGEKTVEPVVLPDTGEEGFGIAEIDQEITAFTFSTIYRADFEDPSRLTLRPDTALTAAVLEVLGGPGPFGLDEDADGRIWISRDETLRVLVPEQDGDRVAYVDVTPPALRSVIHRVIRFYPGPVVWVGTEQGLVRYDPSAERPGLTYTAPFRALVRSAVTDAEDGYIPVAEEADGSVELPHVRSALRFAFAAPSFNAPEATVFRTRLEGFNEGWSAWSDEARRDYTNLPAGSYTFRVEARNAQGVLSQPGAFAFTVLPPWYQTWWARTLFGLAAAAFVAGIVSWRSGHHRRETERERARAAELDRLNTQLEASNVQLQKEDRLKDEMLANASHELRTPLTAILGFSEVLTEYEGGDAREVREYARAICKGGGRLLSTVEALLESAQLRAGKVALHPQRLDVADVARHVAEALAPLARKRGLALEVMPGSLRLPATLDRDALERVLTNLVGNALKFTEKGAVTILLDAVGDDAEGGSLEIAVRDTGIGIREEFLPHLFEPYRQGSTGAARRAEGNGLGLAITKGLVELMGGEISVESEVGAGTTFRVRLPRHSAEAPSVRPRSRRAMAEVGPAPPLMG